MAIEERQHTPSKKIPMTYPSILTGLIQIWIDSTHFFIQVVSSIIILLIQHILLGGSYVYDLIFFLLYMKKEELSTTLFYILSSRGHISNSMVDLTKF